MSPRFIVLDGVEGCGKSTQARKLAAHLRAEGHEVVLTHEPGGTPVGEAIRELILDPAYPEMDPLAELMLFCASRAQHCRQVIAPALQRGAWVVCDRFSSATLAYQGHAGGLGVAAVQQVNRVATAGLEPDLLIVLDADPRVGWARKFSGKQSDPADRIEQKSLQFHEAVREGFRQVARCAKAAVVIDADRSPEEVFSSVIAAILEGAC
jgi:dTMP kinase